MKRVFVCTAIIGLCMLQATAQQHVRRVVVEEFTGTGCGWCPRGWIGMERLKAEGDDRFIGIALHQYNEQDPMYLANYTSLTDMGIYGAPGCAINRAGSTDPYYGTSETTNFGIWADFVGQRDQEPAVDVTLNGVFSDDQKTVTATAEVEFLSTAAGRYTIVYVLTADSLSGTVSSWAQKNYYSSHSAEEMKAVGDPLAEFCAGGEKGRSTVYLTYNDVAIASSYVNGKNTSNALPTTYATGDKTTNSFTLSMPTRSLLKKALHTNLIFVNALVINAGGEIANAARARVLLADEAVEGIKPVNQERRDASAVYNLQGMRLHQPVRGLNIVGGRKIFIR